MTGDDLRAWRVSVNWTVHQLARAMGYASSATVCRWERGTLPIPTVAHLAIMWLMHVTPKAAKTASIKRPRPKYQPWSVRQEEMLLGFDFSKPGAIIEMAIKLGRSEHSIEVKLSRMRQNGLAPSPVRRHAGRGRRLPLPETMVAPKPAGGLMSDAYRVPERRSGEWRSAIQGPQKPPNHPEIDREPRDVERDQNLGHCRAWASTCCPSPT